MLAANRTKRVPLTPRSCGTVDIVARMPPKKKIESSYTLTPIGSSSDTSYSGRLPLQAPLVVPTGQWRVKFELPAGCAPYSEDVRVSEQQAVRVVGTVLCGA